MGKLNVVGKAHEAGQGDAFNWFIYASSLSQGAFAEWADQHGYAVPDFSRAIPARLPGYRLAFNVQSRFWGGAVASLAEDPDRAVEGLVLPLPGAAQGLADHKEGAISGLYRPFDVSVAPLAGGPPVPATAYRASPDRQLPAEAPPSPRFLDALVRGAREANLSAAYLAELEALLAR